MQRIETDKANKKTEYMYIPKKFKNFLDKL